MKFEKNMFLPIERSHGRQNMEVHLYNLTVAKYNIRSCSLIVRASFFIIYLLVAKENYRRDSSTNLGETTKKIWNDTLYRLDKTITQI